MLGGKTLEEKPISMCLHSGDIIVMAKESRLCYHGVPKILPANDEPWNNNISSDSDRQNYYIETDVVKHCLNDSYWKPYQDYIESSRININVRQVLKSGQTTLSS